MEHTLVTTKPLDIYNTFVVLSYASLSMVIMPMLALVHRVLSLYQSVAIASKKISPYGFFTTHPLENKAVNFFGLTP